MRYAALCITLTMVVVGLCVADVPQLINYQGRLIDGGVPVNGTREITFEFYDAAAGGNLLGGFSETQTVTVSGGVFNVLIGSATPGGIPDPGDYAEYYLQVTVNGEPLLPRKRLYCVPFALNAGNAAWAEQAEWADAADNANYAENAGFANNAGNADTVDSMHLADLDNRYVNVKIVRAHV